MNFKSFESANQQLLKNLAHHILSIEKIGPFDSSFGLKWHQDLILLLKSIGWDDYAAELELYRPTHKDIDYANSTMPNPRDSVRKLLNHDNSAKTNFRAASQGYHLVCDEIIKKIDNLIEDRDWWIKAIRDTY